MAIHIRRREFIFTIGSAAAVWLHAARAQQPDRVRRVGVLMGIADDPEGQARVVVFRQALQALGWTEGRNVQLIYRWSAGDVMRARPFAKELVDLRSDVILANTTPIAVAVRDISHTTPTVFVQVSDATAVETAAPLLSIKPFDAAVHNADEMERVIEQFARDPDSAPRTARPLHRNESSIDHRARRPAPLADGLSVPLFRRKRRPDVLWD
jgi:hypothetical protein